MTAASSYGFPLRLPSFSTGGGRFEAAGGYDAPASNDTPPTALVQDLNGDGRAELAVPVFSPSAVAVLTNTLGVCHVHAFRGQIGGRSCPAPRPSRVSHRARPPCASSRVRRRDVTADPGSGRSCRTGPRSTCSSAASGGPDSTLAGQLQNSTLPSCPRGLHELRERSGRPSSTPFSQARQSRSSLPGAGVVVQYPTRPARWRTSWSFTTTRTAAASIAISQIRSISLTSLLAAESSLLQAIIGVETSRLHHSNQRSPPRS